MSATVFADVHYRLQTLINMIEMGQLGLPDLQRPFVWKNAKIRDLFDSMYKGYPVGHLLFWKTALDSQTRTIGTDSKQKAPELLIVDGQQRLTSLYAVFKAVPVIRENSEKEQIRIAFNPLEERFEVADAAVRADKTFIPDISPLWSDEAGLFAVVGGYLDNLKSVRDVDRAEETRVQTAISRLEQMKSFPFTALELSSDIDEEQVSDVFVRINSKGETLNQSDFILTLMSVFWEDGRRQLEKFCGEARQPSKGKPSSYNQYIEPDPDQLLRVSVGLAFRRARLQYVYSILRGKDLETGEMSAERREAQFKILDEAQARTLNLQHWHDFSKHCSLRAIAARR